jgi:hypothetical protein
MKNYITLGSLIMFSCVLSCPAPSPGPPGTPITYVAVTVDGNTYDVSTITTTFNASGSLLESQVWWGNTVLAQAFMTAVGQSLGIGYQGGDQAGPLFNYAADSSDLFSYASFNNTTTPLNFNAGGIGSDSFTFAVATSVTPVPESSANPALLAAAGLFAVWRGWRTVRPVYA